MTDNKLLKQLIQRGAFIEDLVFSPIIICHAEILPNNRLFYVRCPPENHTDVRSKPIEKIKQRGSIALDFYSADDKIQYTVSLIDERRSLVENGAKESVLRWKEALKDKATREGYLDFLNSERLVHKG